MTTKEAYEKIKRRALFDSAFDFVDEEIAKVGEDVEAMEKIRKIVSNYKKGGRVKAEYYITKIEEATKCLTKK